MYRERIELVLQERRISKTELADMLGIKKQNINKLLGASKRMTLKRVADALGITLEELLGETINEALFEEPQIQGFLEVDGVIHKISNFDELKCIYTHLCEGVFVIGQ